MRSYIVRLFRQLWYDGRLFVANCIVARIPIHSLRLLFYRKAMKIKVGKRSSILMGARFYTIGKLVIGENSIVNDNCRLDARGGLTIGNSVSISSETCILTAEHDVQSRDFKGNNAPVHIEDYVFAGTRSMILPGVWLKKGAVVAAGAVVTKNVEAYTVVGGVPARVIRTRNPDLDYQCFYRPFFQ